MTRRNNGDMWCKLVAKASGIDESDIRKGISKWPKERKAWFKLPLSKELEKNVDAVIDSSSPEELSQLLAQLKAMVELNEAIEKKQVFVMSYAHDEWCGIFKTGECNCNPDITFTNL